MGYFELQRSIEDNEELKKLYDEIILSGFGEAFPINWFTSQASRPDILASTWALVKGVLVDGKLPGTIKQMIAMVVSKQNNCRYCSVTHTSALESMGVPMDVIQKSATNIETAEIPLAHKEIIKFALKSAKDPNSINQEDYQVLKENGLNKGEILEVIMMAAFTNFINTWADASGIPLDSEGVGSGEEDSAA